MFQNALSELGARARILKSYMKMIVNVSSKTVI